ncbi:hypothetical protein PENTCL1PPCAC_7318, partial [Pristionchus entomophagus]
MKRIYYKAVKEAVIALRRAEEAEKILAESVVQVNDRKLMDELQITIRDQSIQMENLKEQLTAAARPPPDPVSIKVETMKKESMTNERMKIVELEKELESVKEVNKLIMNTSIGKATKEVDELKEKMARLEVEVEDLKRRS